jgi:hypothetical protein
MFCLSVFQTCVCLQFLLCLLLEYGPVLTQSYNFICCFFFLRQCSRSSENETSLTKCNFRFISIGGFDVFTILNHVSDYTSLSRRQIIKARLYRHLSIFLDISSIIYRTAMPCHPALIISWHFMCSAIVYLFPGSFDIKILEMSDVSITLLCKQFSEKLDHELIICAGSFKCRI